MSILTLKWGTLKGWNFEDHPELYEKAKPLLDKYHDIGASVSVMAQKDTEEQKQIIKNIIDLLEDGDIYLSWDSKCVSKEEAKKYIDDYGSRPS